MLLFTHHCPARCFCMNMPKSREFQAKIPSPKAIFIGFLLVTVKVLNSYDYLVIDADELLRCFAAHAILHHSIFPHFFLQKVPFYAGSFPFKRRIRWRAATLRGFCRSSTIQMWRPSIFSSISISTMLPSSSSFFTSSRGMKPTPRP